MEIKNIIQKGIEKILKDKPIQRFDWKDSMYEDTQYLSIDERGQLGENVAVSILKDFGCSIDYDSGVTSATKGYDFISNNIKIEVKTATITIGSGQFQHENLHSQRNFDAILFIDIAPTKSLRQL